MPTLLADRLGHAECHARRPTHVLEVSVSDCRCDYCPSYFEAGSLSVVARVSQPYPPVHILANHLVERRQPHSVMCLISDPPRMSSGAIRVHRSFPEITLIATECHVRIGYGAVASFLLINFRSTTHLLDCLAVYSLRLFDRHATIVRIVHVVIVQNLGVHHDFPGVHGKVGIIK